MRQYQITINLHALTDGNQRKEFAVYADSNNLWETISAGFYELLHTIRNEMGVELPVFGRREHYFK